MTKLTAAQQRVLDYLNEHAAGDFVIVPSGVTNDVRTLDILVERGLIEEEWRPAPLPPGSFAMVYRLTTNEERAEQRSIHLGERNH